LEPLRIVVPSVHFRDWLQVQIARRFGICMGFEFSMPKDFVVDVFRAAGISRAEECDQAAFGVGHPSKNPPNCQNCCRPCRPLDRSAIGSQWRARWLIASTNTRTFVLKMLSKWAGGRDWLEAQSPDERWQRALWSALHQSLESDLGLIPSRLESPGALEKLRVAFPRLTVIGSGSLDPLLVEILARLRASGSRVFVPYRPALPWLSR
jgi:exonuclease V gamma subunit